MDQSSASFERFRSCLNSDDAGDDDDDKVDDDDDDDNRNLASSPFLTKPRAISSLYSTCTPIWPSLWPRWWTLWCLQSWLCTLWRLRWQLWTKWWWFWPLHSHTGNLPPHNPHRQNHCPEQIVEDYLGPSLQNFSCLEGGIIWNPNILWKAHWFEKLFAMLQCVLPTTISDNDDDEDEDDDDADDDWDWFPLTCFVS